MAEQQFQPVWSKEQLKQFTNLYQGRGHLLSPDYKQKIEQHAAHYNVPFYEGEGGIANTIGAIGTGFMESFTLNFYKGDAPKTQSEAIARNIGNLVGFAPQVIAAPLRGLAKISGSSAMRRLAGRASGLTSPSMALADRARDKASKVANDVLASANKKNIDNLTGVQKLLLGGGARNVSEQAFHLGVASASQSLPDLLLKGDFGATLNAFMGGATLGGAFGLVGEGAGLTAPALKKMFENPNTAARAELLLKGAIGGSGDALLAKSQGATDPELVYEFLLGSYFGANAPDWKNAGALKFLEKIETKAREGTKREKEVHRKWEAETGSDLEAHPDFIDEPFHVKEAIKTHQVRYGTPEENIKNAAQRQILEEIYGKEGLEEIVRESKEKTPEGFVDEGEYIDGDKVISVKESALKEDRYISTAGNLGDAKLARITGEYGLPTINYVPFRTAKDDVVGLDRPLTEDQLQQANRHIVKASKAKHLQVKDKKEKKMVPRNTATLSEVGRKGIQKNYWAVKNAKEVYIVADIDPASGYIGFNHRMKLEWPMQFAKDLNKRLIVLNNRDGQWYEYNRVTQRFIATDIPKKPAKNIAVLGGDTLSPNTYKAMHGWLGKHFKKAPIVDEVAKREAKEKRKTVEEVQSLANRNIAIKKEIDVLSSQEATDENLDKIKLLNETLEANKTRLETIDAETPAGFISKAFANKERASEDVNETIEFDSENLERLNHRAVHFSQRFLKDFWGTKQGFETPFDQRAEKMRLSDKFVEVFDTYKERGSKVNRSDDIVADLETFFKDDYGLKDFSFNDDAKGYIRQQVTRHNLGKPIMHLQSDGKSFFYMPSATNQVSRAGNRKIQNEPEKFIETVYKNITGSDDPSLFVLDHVTMDNKKTGINSDFNISAYRRDDAKGYKEFINNIAQKADSENMYIFGGASDKDRIYFMKYHPAMDQLSFKDLVKAGLVSSKDFRKSRESSAEAMGLSKEQHDKAFMSNILYEMSMNGFDINLDNLKKFANKDNGFVRGSAPYNKRAQIWFTNSYSGDTEFVKSNYVEEISSPEKTVSTKDLDVKFQGVQGPAGRLVAMLLRENPGLIKDKTVIDLGSGTDFDTYKEALIKLGAKDVKGVDPNFSADYKTDMLSFLKSQPDNSIEALSMNAIEFGPVVISGKDAIKYKNAVESEINRAMKTDGIVISGGTTNEYDLNIGQKRNTLDDNLISDISIYSGFPKGKGARTKSLLNKNGKYNIVIVKDLLKELDDYGLKELDSIENPEHVDGAIIVPDRLLDVINKDFGNPDSGQNKSFIVSPNDEHGALLGKYMMHSAGDKLSAEMEAQGLHMIMQESAVKQRGTREKPGDYRLENGKLIVDAPIYEIDPSDVKGSYSVYGNDHFFEPQRLPKQVMMNMLNASFDPMDQEVIDTAFEDIIGKRWIGDKSWNDKLQAYIDKSAESKEPFESAAELIDNIENIGIREVVDAIRQKATPQLAEGLYQKMLKVAKENIAIEHRDGNISDAEYDGYLNELVDFNSITDRVIKQATAISEKARESGYDISADSIYNHKFVRDFKAKSIQNYLVNTATKPKMANSGSAYMRPYDKALQIDLDNVNPLLKSDDQMGINKNDETFMLDDGHKQTPIWLIDSKTGKEVNRPVPLIKVWNEYQRLIEKPTNDKEDARIEYLTDVLKAATVRVPMDSVSGMQVLNFGGFTGRKGHGILLHSRTMRAEGGADLDGDKAFYYFGGTRGMAKDMMQQFYKNKDEFKFINKDGKESYKDNKKAKLDKSVGKFKKGTQIRELLALSGSDDEMYLANQDMGHYSPSERLRISEAAVDGRNQLGPAVSNSQLMKATYNSLLASGGRDVLDLGIYVAKGDYRRFKVTVEAKTGEDDVKFQRDMGRAQLGLASDPMDEIGLKDINTWKKLLWDSYFDVVDIKEQGVKGKSKWEDKVLETIVDGKKLPYSYTNSGLFGNMADLNKALYSRNWGENRKFTMDELQGMLAASIDITNTPGASNSFLPKIGNLFLNLDWSDSPFNRLNHQRVFRAYRDSNNKIKERKWLQDLFGRSSMKVAYTNQIENIFKYELYDTSSIVEHASVLDKFYDAIEGTQYVNRVKLDKSIVEYSIDGFTKRKHLLNEMLKQGEDFIVNDMSDIITMDIIENIVRNNNIDSERFKLISKKVESLKQKSYLKARDRKRIYEFIDSSQDKDSIEGVLSTMTEAQRKSIGLEEYVPSSQRASKEELRTAEMDQAQIDEQIQQFREKEKLNQAENMLFDQLMLGSINAGKKSAKIAELEGNTEALKNPIFLDFLKNLRYINSSTAVSRLGFSSMAIDDASLRLHIQKYMEKMNENSIPLKQSELDDLNDKLDGTVKAHPPVVDTIQKRATNTGFENIDWKAESVSDKEFARIIVETGELLRNQPNIIYGDSYLKTGVKDVSGKSLNEFTRGLEFIRKDFDAMNKADILKLNRFLRQIKEGTIWQRIKAMFGKDKNALSWRSWQQLPSTTNRELMANDIDTIKKEGFFTDAQGVVQRGSVRVPTQFMDRLSNNIGRMLEMGTQVGDEFVNDFQESQSFYQGLEEAPLLWEIAIRQREYAGRHQYRASRAKAGKNSNDTEASITHMRVKLQEAEKAADWNNIKGNENWVNIDGKRVKLTNKEIVDRINGNVTSFMQKMHEVIRGNENMRGEKSPYFIEWYDDAKKSPKYDHKAFLKDLDIYLNGRVPKRWSKLMKSTNESIPSLFGVDGVRAMMREMHIDFMRELSKSKTIDKNAQNAYSKRAKKLAAFPVKDTGQLPFEYYFPRMFFDPVVGKAELKKATKKILERPGSDNEKIKELQKVQRRHKRLDGDYYFEDLQDYENLDKLMEELKEGEDKTIKNMENWFSLDVSMGNMRTREHSTPGWSVAPTAVEAYVRSLSNTYFRGVAGMVSRDIVSNPKTGIYKKLVSKWGHDNAKAWTEFAKLYVNDALGNVINVTDEMIKDDKLALKYSPYKYFADNKVAGQVARISAKLGLKGVVGKDEKGKEIILGGVDAYDIKRWSQMEAKYQMSTLLAHPKSAFANIFGGTLHTIQSAGLSAFRNVNKYEYLTQINPELKTRKDVEDWVIGHGVMPQWLLYELGLQKEFKTDEGKKLLSVISNYVKRKPDATPDEFKMYLKGQSQRFSDKLTDIASKFMSIPERRLRTDAFMAHYIKAWESFGGAIKDPNHPFLIEMGKKGVSATQFMYNAPFRPAFARTSLGKVFTRFQMYAWNSLRLRGDIMRQFEVTGYDINTPEGQAAKRFMMGDMFMLAMATMFPYSLFENNLPQPYGWFQDTTDWLFGNEEERDRAFFGMYPSAIAPLQAVTPPIGRVGLVVSSILNGDLERATNYYIPTLFPFGRIYKDTFLKGGLVEAPIRLVDKLTGIPLTQIQRKKSRLTAEESNILYPKAIIGGYE